MILGAICHDLPFAFTSQLHLAGLADTRGDLRAAVTGYLRAIKTAQLQGFWLDETSTPSYLVPLVMRAMDLAETGRIDLFHEWLEPHAARYGKDELARVTRGLAMYLGIEPSVRDDPRQQPTFFYVPGLPVAPVFPPDALPFTELYEASTASIAVEMRAVLEGPGVQPFHYDVADGQRSQLVAGGSWDAYFFFVDGVRIGPHHDACPQTSAALGLLPLDHVRDHGPEVCFSIMRPGAHILPHRGVTNTRAVLHLGLEVPDGCALNLVGIREITWDVGRCFAFDDTFEHEAWNHSATPRVVLLADIWNPYLRAAERDVLADLVAFIGDFNRDAAAAHLLPED